MITQSDFLFVFASIALTLYLRFFYKPTSRHPYPPGPRRLPIIGNLHQFPQSPEWVTYDKWSKEFGSDLIYIRGAGMEFVVLSSYASMVDLFDKRSLIYSSRPDFPMAGDLMGWDWMFAALPYGNKWRERRRAFTQYFHPSDHAVYRPNHIEFVRGMLVRLLEDPNDVFSILKDAVGGSSLGMAYGLPIKKKDDPYVQLGNKAIATLNNAVLPANYLVNIFPALKYVPEFLPGAGFKKTARQYKKLQEKFLNVPFSDALDLMNTGNCRPSFMSSSLECVSELKGDERSHRVDVVREAAAQVFQASVDATLSGLQAFIAVMVLFPEAQRKAQSELDRVLGDRLPEFSDEADLPYLTALVTELLRWNPMTPVGLPHKCTRDDVYKGYHIPKGAIVMPNLWALMYDEKNFPNPSIFSPDRFMRDGKLCYDGIPDPRDIIFGFGRRSCPGRHIGLSFLWLATGSILSMFNISKAKDEHGKDIEPHIKPMYGMVIEYEPFECAITPRSKEAVERIRAAAA